MYNCNKHTCFYQTAVQIHHELERDHWVVSSYIDAEVRLYDSLSNGKISNSLSVQLAELYRPAIRNDLLPVTLVSVQQQEGSSDCGPFSIANAFHIACGDNLRRITFAQKSLRPHLENCFEANQLARFSCSDTPVRRSRLKHAFVTVHCSCRRPACYDIDMVECEDCKKWFHFKCVHIRKTSVPPCWKCQQCSV